MSQPPNDPAVHRHATTTRHRPGCTRSGWQLEESRTLRGCQIARCLGCSAIELRTEANQ